MKRAYKAVLHGDRVEWLNGAPDAEGAIADPCHLGHTQA